MRRGLALGWVLVAAAGAFAASPEDRTCGVRRPATPVPPNFKPLLVDVAVPCSGEASVADRLALVARPPVSSSPTRVLRHVRPHLAYYGGPVISNVKVVSLRWSAAVPADRSAAMEGFYRSFTNGAMFDWLSKYDTAGQVGFADRLPGSAQRIGHGSFAGTYTMTPGVGNTGNVVSPSQISDELVAHAASGAIPPPEVDAQGNPVTIYMIEFPDTVTIKAGSLHSCVDYCAFHASTRVEGVRAAYAVLPAVAGGCLSGCAARPDPFDIGTVNASHELVEAVTDPAIAEVARDLARPAAWFDARPDQGEIGDICDFPFTDDDDEMLDGYWVQREWSNRWRACIVAPPPGTLP